MTAALDLDAGDRTPRPFDSVTASILTEWTSPYAEGRALTRFTPDDLARIEDARESGGTVVVQDVLTGTWLSAWWGDCGGACRCALYVRRTQEQWG